MKSIVWLASYPKSGNTWLRMFLANYLLPGDQPVPLSKMHQIALGDSLLGAYRKLSRGPLDPRNQSAVLALRPAVLKAIAGNGADINLVKTHNQNTRAYGAELIPAAVTRLAIYVVRNPLDLLLSYAHHYGMTPEAAARALGDPGNVVMPDANNVTQYLGSWSDHVTGWTQARNFPVCTLRYEDMIADPASSFSAALKRMGVPVEPDRLARAIEFSSFDQLRSQEEAHGFIEKSRHAERFFRAGTAGQWRETLAPDIVARIREKHGSVMRKFGYLDE
jgi:hypothetical protein